MTIPCGSTTSSPDTRLTVKLEDAPFSEYLRVLRENGYGSDADLSELFYIDLLKNVELGNGKLSVDQIYATPFKKLVEAAELLIEEANRQIMSAVPPPTVGGPVLVGKDAEKLSPEQLQYLMRRQLEATEAEKMRLQR